MKHDIYEMDHAPEIEKVLDELRVKISNGGAGVTISGNRLTVRWSDGQGKPLKHVHAVIIEVDDGVDGDECPTCENPEVYYDEVAECYACHACGWHHEERPTGGERP